MSDRICIMRDGQIVQVGGPRDLYDRPRNRYVADFIGKSNFFEGRVSAVEGGTARLEAPGGVVFTGPAGAGVSAGRAATASLRPEQIGLSREAGGLPVTVVNRIFLGEHTEYLVRNPDLGQFLILVSRQAEAGEGNLEPGEAGSARWRDGAALILDND